VQLPRGLLRRRPPAMQLLGLASLAAVAWALRPAAALLGAAETCPGAIDVPGYGPVQLVATQWNVAKDAAAKVDVVNGQVLPHLKGRAYFADSCQAGKYNFNDYVALGLLGKSLRFTADLSSAGCGCNVALYLTNLHQNPNISNCLDYYCDANSVCGVPCPEIDVMEANQFAWHSTLHTSDDRFGKGAGYGGGGPGWNGPRDWDSSQYGPGGSCIDTNFPFQVAASFPVDESEKLTAMTITLSQPSRPCTLSVTIDGYDGNTSKWAKGDGHGMLELTDALRAGMTPIASFWESKDMLWMDGNGNDTLGPCSKDLVHQCPEVVPMYDFSVVSLTPSKQQQEHGHMLYAMVAVGCVILAALAAGLYLVASRKSHRLLGEENESAD